MPKAAPAAKPSFSLNFSNTPVSPDVIAAAVEERKKESQKKQALLVAADIEACQNIVNLNLARLRVLREQLKAFEVNFRKLKDLGSPAEFVKVLNENSNLVGCCHIHLQGDYSESSVSLD